MPSNVGEKFFSGTRFEKAFTYQIDPRVRVNLRISSCWIDPGIGQSSHCGQSSTFSIERIVGLTRAESEKLAAELSSEIGIEKVAGLKSSLSISSEHSITLEESKSIRREFQITSDRCGSTRIKLFQKSLIIDFLVQRKTFFGGVRESRFQVTELTQTFDCRVDVEEMVESCGCAKDAVKPASGQIRMFWRNLSLLLPFFRNESGFRLGYLNLDFDVDPRDFRGVATATLARDSLPPLLQFLASAPETETDAAIGFELWSLHEGDYTQLEAWDDIAQDNAGISTSPRPHSAAPRKEVGRIRSLGTETYESPGLAEFWGGLPPETLRNIPLFGANGSE